MWLLTGFADEISPDFNEQLDTLQSVNVRYLELRSVEKQGVLTLSDEQIAAMKQELQRRAIRVSAIGSPIGKIDITESFEPHFQEFQRALAVADVLKAPYIRIFSFWIPEGRHADYRNEVMDRLAALTKEAEEHGIRLVHENERRIYGDIPERCLDIMETIDNDYLRLAWDPANFVQCGVRPFQEGYAALRPYIEYVHVKDARLNDGCVTVAGDGDGEVRETVRALRESGFEGFFSLEPHLSRNERYADVSQQRRFVLALQGFQRLLKEEGIRWDGASGA